MHSVLEVSTRQNQQIDAHEKEILMTMTNINCRYSCKYEGCKKKHTYKLRLSILLLMIYCIHNKFLFRYRNIFEATDEYN